MGAVCGYLAAVPGGEPGLALVARMLAGLSSRGGAQPRTLVSEDGVAALACRASGAGGDGVAQGGDARSTILLAMDGSLLNADELRKPLPAPAPATDAELALQLYALHGPEFIREADGSFAIAVYDSRAGSFYLFRDRLGACPLYWTRTGAGVFFASQPSALTVQGLARARLSAQGLYHFVTLLNVPASGTLFDGVHRVPPGHYLCVPRAGGANEVRYWDAVGALRGLSEPAYVEALRGTHRASVERSLRHGGRIGALLSGGNDSSANVALLSALAPGPLHTFTSAVEGFEGSAAQSDTVFARQVADHFGTVHHERLLTQREFIDYVERSCATLDDMVSEPATVLLYASLEAVRQEGLNVVYAGEANDELMCGHRGMIEASDTYYDRWLPASRKPRAVRWFAWQALGRLYALRGQHPGRQDALRRLARDEGLFWSYEIAFVEAEKHKLFTGDFLERVGDASTYDVVRPVLERFHQARPDADFLDEIIYVMTQDYLANLMLNKLDRAGAAFGLVSRTPYTAHDYVDVALSIPAPMKMAGGDVKTIFRKAIEPLLPREIVYRKKQGFRTPLPEMCRGELGEWMLTRIMESALLRDEGVFRPAYVERIYARHRDGTFDFSTRLWTLMCACLWYDKFVKAHG